MAKKMKSAKRQHSGRKKRPTGRQTTQIIPMQLELLDMFAHKQLSDQEMEEVKDLISNYFLEKAQDEVEALAEHKH